MTTTQPQIGSFPTKREMYPVFRDFILPLNMIAFVHRRGAKKYPLYKWYNDPHQCDSSIIANLNAIYRHFAAYSMGFSMDPEGLPHVFHMCCRAGMMITTAYRKWNNCTELLANGTGDSDTLKYGALGGNFFNFITPEEVVSLTKTNDITYSSNEAELKPIVHQILSSCLRNYVEYSQLNVTEKDFNIFTTTTELDILFRVICYLATAYWKNCPYLDLDNTDLFDEDERYWATKLFGANPHLFDDTENPDKYA